MTKNVVMTLAFLVATVFGGLAASAECGATGCGDVLADGCGACGDLGSGCDSGPLKLISLDDSCLDIGGWTQLGYHNKDSYADLFNQNSGKFNLHQQWLYLEKALDPAPCGWDWGFRFDAMYGIDADNTASFGNNYGNWDYADEFEHGNYGFALPQAYVELGCEDLSIKMGHFYTLIGYEVVTAPDNFFYSHAFTMNNSEPFTHTGVLTTFNASEDITLYGGWSAGWDTGFDQLDGGSNFLGGVSLQLSEDAALTYITTFGDFGWAGEDAYSHSLVLDLQLTEKLNYVLQSDLMTLPEYPSQPVTSVETFGINQYLFYTISDCWAVGTRLEWWKADGESGNELTFGVNWKPCENVRVRPEIRQEWVPAYDLSQTIFGVDTVISY